MKPTLKTALASLVWVALLFAFCRAVLGMAEQSVNDSSRYAKEYHEMLKQVQQEQEQPYQYIAPVDEVIIELRDLESQESERTHDTL